jgi:hypothetical protein
MSDVKVFLVKPPLDKRDWDLEDVRQIACSIGKKLFQTSQDVRIFKLSWDKDLSCYVAYAVPCGCTIPLVVNGTEKDSV